MKKLIMILLITVMILPSSVFANNEVEVAIPDFDVEIGGEIIDNERNTYPLIVYKNITYFPMTWNFSRSLGLATNWNPDTGLSIDKTTQVEKLKQDLSANNDLTKTYTATIADFNIGLNDKQIDNSTEEYPILIFRNITYFPLTWKFTVEEFGWESDWDQEKGLSINNTSIVNNINIDNSMNNNTTASDISDSSVVITNNNIDNSVNDSNNTYNDNSTTITNNIDNSTTVNANADILAEILAEIAKLKETGITSGNLIVSYELKDANTKEPIADAVIYMNNSPVGVTDENGKAELSVYQYAQYSVQIEHPEYKNLSIVEGYNDASIVVKNMVKKSDYQSDLGEIIMVIEDGYEIIDLNSSDLDFEPLKKMSSFKDKKFVINSLEKSIVEEYVYIKIDYESPIEQDSVGMRFGGDAEGLRSFMSEDTPIKEGQNIFVFRIKHETLLNGKTAVCLEVGDEHSVSIDYKEILD